MAVFDMNMNNIRFALKAVQALPDEHFLPLMNDDTASAIIKQLFVPIKGRNTHLNADDTKELFGIQSLDDISELEKLSRKQLAVSTIVYYKARFDGTPDRNKGALRKVTQCFGMGNDAEKYINDVCSAAGISHIPQGGIGGGGGSENEISEISRVLQAETAVSEAVPDPVQPSEAVQAVRPKTAQEKAAGKRQATNNMPQAIQKIQPVETVINPQPVTAPSTSANVAIPTETEIHVFNPLTLDDILYTPKLDFITDNFIVRNTVNVFYAPGKTGKTFTCLHYGMCMAKGIPFLGMETHLNRNIGYLNLDMFRGGFNDRIKQVMRGFNPNITTDEMAFLMNRIKILDREEIRRANGNIPNFFDYKYLDDLKFYINANDIEFLFIDTFSRIRAGSAENSNDDMATVLQNAEEFFTPLQCTSLFIHHTGKDGNLRGAQAIIDNAEFVFGLKKVNGSNKHLKLFSDTPRYTDTFEFDIYPEFKECTNEETGASYADAYFLTTIDPDTKDTAIVDFLKTHENPWMSKTNLAKAAGGNYEARRREVDSLYAQNILTRQKSGNGFVYRLKNV